jgi:hypothetical protein
MRIDSKTKTVFLTDEDLERGFCPIRPSWALRILELYGVEKLYKSDLIESLKRCPDILRKLGFKVIHEETGREL